MDATLIVESDQGDVERRPIRDLVRELTTQLRPIADELGSGHWIDHLLDILSAGSGTERQRRVLERGGTLVDVVHHLADELAGDRPIS